MFQLTEEEAEVLRSQIVTLEKGRGRYPKYAPLKVRAKLLILKHRRIPAFSLVLVGRRPMGTPLKNRSLAVTPRKRVAPTYRTVTARERSMREFLSPLVGRRPMGAPLVDPKENAKAAGSPSVIVLRPFEIKDVPLERIDGHRSYSGCYLP